jgi:hypothetical protein
MMTNALIRISPVDASAYQQANDLRKDLKGLQSALTKGDLASAQSALSQLQQDIRSSNTQSNGVRVSPDDNPQAILSRDIQALQLALNAGDLTAVKAASIECSRIRNRLRRHSSRAPPNLRRTIAPTVRSPIPRSWQQKVWEI